MEQDNIIDISKMVSAQTAVWPGDSNFHMQRMLSLKSGDAVNLTTLTISAHTGTHADAPYHVQDHGLTIDQVNLFQYWGAAQVVTVSLAEGPLMPEHFCEYDLTLAQRLLVRTPVAQIPFDQFPELIPYPSPELARHLAAEGILLYGTDTPSMDALDSSTFPGHQALINNQIAILEGLDLRKARDGIYELCALPLKIAGGDGSPVRAALRVLGSRTS